MKLTVAQVGALIEMWERSMADKDLHQYVPGRHEPRDLHGTALYALWRLGLVELSDRGPWVLPEACRGPEAVARTEEDHAG